MPDCDAVPDAGSLIRAAHAKLAEQAIEAAMSRYYFEVTDGKEVLRPPHGIDLLGNAAAREEAMRLAYDLKHSAERRNWDGWFVKITDSHGHRIDTVPIDVTPDEPPAP